MLKIDSTGVGIPADGFSIRRIYLYNITDIFQIQVMPCMAGFPYGYECRMMDVNQGIGYIELGPVPKDQADKLFFILIGDVVNGRGYRIPIQTTHTAKRIA